MRIGPQIHRVPDGIENEIEVESGDNRRKGPGPTISPTLSIRPVTGAQGVMIEHRGLCNVAEDLRRCYRQGPSDRVLAAASAGFDASIFDFVLAPDERRLFVHGAPSVVLPNEDLASFMRRERVTTAGLTPTAWAALPSINLPDLRILKSGGEMLPAELVERWAAAVTSGTRTVRPSHDLCVRGEAKPGQGGR